VAEGDGEGEVFSFLVVLVVSFFVVSVDDFLVDDFLVVVDVLAGAFSGAVVVVSVLLVQAPRSAATARQVME
jgi:hypothetical protein